MIKQEHKVIILSILAGIVFWFCDAAADHFFKFPEVPFLKILVYDAPTHEFFIRPLVVIFFIFFGMITARYIGRVRDSEGRYHQLFDSLEEAIFFRPYKNPDGLEKFFEVNAVACEKLGYSREELLQLSPLELTAPEERPNIPAFLDRLRDDKHVQFETALLKKDGARLPVEINVHLVDFRGEPVVLSLARDITTRKASEAEIRRLASFPQLIPNPVLEVNPAGEIIFSNVATTETLKKLGLQDPGVFLPGDLAEIIRDARETGLNQFHRELKIKDAIFSEFIHFCSQWNVARLFPTDITERQKGEEALRESARQLRLLTSQLFNVQEAERRRISIELHDELGQALMFLKLQLGTFQDRLRKDQQGLRNDCDYLLHHLDGVIEEVRRLSRDLSPSVLEELGLTSAIKLLLEEFGKLYGVEANAADLDEVDQLFSHRVQLNIYRIFQEALTNIGKHAAATHISVVAKRQNGHVSFMVQDDGKGFDQEQVLARQAAGRGIGMATIAERVRMIGGTLEIQSQERWGTKITFTVPVELGGGNGVSLDNSLGR